MSGHRNGGEGIRSAVMISGNGCVRIQNICAYFRKDAGGVRNIVGNGGVAVGNSVVSIGDVHVDVYCKFGLGLEG